MIDAFKIKLTVQKSDNIGDWYEILVAGLPDMYWMMKTVEGCHDFPHSRLHSLRRISDCCVEGTLGEMKALARGIREQTAVEFNRCAVTFEYGNAYFWSPRNSQFMGEVPLAVAVELAVEIEKLS